MVELKAGRHEFRFSGDHVNCVISAIDRQTAEEWLRRGAKALFHHTITATEDELNELKGDPAFIGNYRDIREVVRLEGCELHNGHFECVDASGTFVERQSTESAKFGEYIDELVKVDPEGHLLDGQATLIVRTFYGGESTYKFHVVDPDEFGWYVKVVDMGFEPFIGTLNVNSEDIAPSVTGPHERQVVTLNVPGGRGAVKTISHSERSEDV